MNFQISGFLSQRKASKVFENKKKCAGLRAVAALPHKPVGIMRFRHHGAVMKSVWKEMKGYLERMVM